MFEFLTAVYLFYIFVALYFLLLYALLYFFNRKNMFFSPEITKYYSIDVVVPCYNCEKNIADTIRSLLDSDYRGLWKIIVVDDCSTDNSYRIMKQIARKNSRVIAVKTPKNTGNAAGAKDYGAKFSKAELIGFTDDDSSPQKDAISKMVGFFDNPKTGAVTSMVLVKNKNNFIEKLQSREYRIIAFTRKLLGFIGAIYVTPGPLAIYRRKAFNEVGGFDKKNLTEDIEITWHIISRGYNVELSLLSRVHTVVPENISSWFKQRIRWNIGGIQTINKYKKEFFGKGILGSFILPFFVFSWFLGILGLIILIYRSVRGFIVNYLSVSYSLKSQVAVLSLSDINLIPNVLVFFGALTLVLTFVFTFTAFRYSKDKEFKDIEFFSILVYIFIYLLLYPVVLAVSIYKFLRGKHSW